jgi:hypothetical protein
MKINPVLLEFSRVERRTDGHEEANRRVFKNFDNERAKQMGTHDSKSQTFVVHSSVETPSSIVHPW